MAKVNMQKLGAAAMKLSDGVHSAGKSAGKAAGQVH